MVIGNKTIYIVIALILLAIIVIPYTGLDMKTALTVSAPGVVTKNISQSYVDVQRDSMAVASLSNKNEAGGKNLLDGRAHSYQDHSDPTESGLSRAHVSAHLDATLGATPGATPGATLGSSSNFEQPYSSNRSSFSPAHGKIHGKSWADHNGPYYNQVH